MNERHRYWASGPLYLLVIGLLFLQNSYGLVGLDMSKQTVIAERTSRGGVRTILAVDADDVIHEIGIGLPDTKRDAVIEANLGSRVTNSGSVDLSQVLPKDRVAALARRVSLADGLTIHVVIAWGFSQYPDILLLYAHLYVFREQHGQIKQVVAEELGTTLGQVVVEDINHDGRVEILAASTENAVESMNIWQIQPEGAVTKIQRIDGYSVHTLADRFVDQEEGIIVEHKTTSSTPGAVCFRIDEYVWSTKQQRFIKGRE